LPPSERTLAPPAEEEVAELDGLCSFVFEKRRKRWVWLALCRRTRQVVAYAIGNRGEESRRKLWERIPESYREGSSYSDFWESYQKVFPEDRHQAVGKESGQTGHVERWNGTLRQRLGRFGQKDFVVFQERGDARDLLGTVLALLQSALLENNMK